MVLGIIFLALLLADQISKAVVFALIDSPHKIVSVIPGFLQLNTIRNTGASYGLLAGWDFAQPFLIIVTCVALIVMLIVLIKLQRKKRFLRASLVIVMAGAAGNLVDRVVESSVRDFIDLSVGNIRFLNFNCNVADIAVTVGAVMLVLALLFIDKDSLVRSLMHKKQEKEEVQAAADELTGGSVEKVNIPDAPQPDKQEAGSALSEDNGQDGQGG